MATATAPKVRLVRCPKCLLVLPEVADFPVYKCGGCDTILVAKNKKAIAKGTSVLQETGAAVTKPVRVLERGESSGSALQEPLPLPSASRSSHESGGNQDISTGSCSEEHGEDLSVEGQHNGRYEKDRNASRYGNGDGESDRDMLDESGSNEGKQNGTGLLQAESLGRYEKDQNKSGESDDESDRGMLDESRSNEGQQNGTGLLQTESLEQYEKDRNTSGYSDGDDDGERDCDMLDVSRSNEGKQNGTELLQRESLDRYEEDQNTFGDSDGDGESDHGMLDESRSNEGQQNGTGLLQTESFEHCDVQQPGVPAEGSLSTELRHGNVELMLEISTDSHSDEHGENLSVEGQHNGCYEKDKNTSRDSDCDGESDCDMLDENRSNEEPMWAAETNIEAEANGMTSQLEGVNSELETSNKIDSNPGGSWIGERCGVTSARSTDTFQTVDFFSLCSEFSGPPECLSKSTTVRSSHAYDGSISSYDGIDDHFSDQQLHSFENSYKPANKKHYEMEKYGKWHRDEPLEPVMHHRPPRSWPRPERDQYPSQVPLSQRTPLRDYESAGPSRESRDEFPFDSPFRPFEKAKHSEEEKMKLLRMVYELQDQLSRTNVSASSDVPWKEKHYNNHREPLEDENFYPAYYGERDFNRRSRLSRVPFSGGAINNRHGIDNTCLCCHPQAWNHPEQFPPPMFPHNRGFCRVGPGHSCYNSYSSLPCSPQRYMESDFSNRVHETQSDDQRYADHELKRYLREKHHSARRHIRPTAGGAPFITCYHCIRPLQLPADFLLFRRRFHQLRCGACSKVLKFSLLKGTHIVPYELVAAEPPPSEVEDCNDAIDARISGSASSSHGHMQADPLSYSDDYGHSFDISCSTDGNPVSHAKFHHLQGSNADVQNMSSSSSKPMETFDSARQSRSKKVSSGTEGSPPRTGGSTLHRLMGYSSLSQVLRGRRPSISSTSSSHFGKDNSGSNS
ncbi:hypothetical protein HRI_001695100 [Hibiscus trionum]|uniref:Zinc-ribbon domain-containing protein n=1 Tax=Hibiscus trionum TaxID=183268 RepID=A0A9W7HP18_HIBTR|nr:hypothetical protein HRI_001695100 [Hibiscus trionum]